MITNHDVLEHFKRKPKPQSFRELAWAFGLNRAETRKFKRTLRDMLHSGELVLTRKGLYAPSEEISLVRGYFEAHGDGYGFVIPDAPGQRDLFIPPPATMGAMDNDRVIARSEPPGRKGRVIRILERAQRKVSGTVEKTRSSCFVKPKSKAVPFDIYIPPGECARVKDGQKVMVEIIEYPSDKRPPTGRIVKTLKQAEKPLEEIESAMEEFNLPKKFPREVAEEAKAVSEIKDRSRRKDLTRLPTVTIDGERAKDFDDAISIGLSDIGYRLWVHIADVSHYVDWDSPIDLEARKRGTSVYFPDRVVPMLPSELSEDLCSLVPGRKRRAFTVEMDFDRYGKRYEAKFYKSLILSDERMTYTSVNRIITGDENERARYGRLLKDFELMGELASRIRERRFARGSLDFDLPEPEILLDMQGRPEAIIKSERNFAHIIIEEFMIAANEAVAEYLQSAEMPSIYRIHEEPDPQKIEEVLSFGKTVLRRRASDIHELLGNAHGSPEEGIINLMVLRSLKQARYSTVNAGHFGLASECYTHFTSPIRRYPDLIVHRILQEALLAGQKKRISDERAARLNELLPEIAFNSSRMERNSDDAERAVLNAMKVWFMKDKVGEEFPCTITEVTNYGFRVLFDDFYVEGFIHVSALTDDFYRFDEKSLTLGGRHTGRKFRTGDRVKVGVDRVDVDEKEIVLGLR